MPASCSRRICSDRNRAVFMDVLVAVIEIAGEQTARRPARRDRDRRCARKRGAVRSRSVRRGQDRERASERSGESRWTSAAWMKRKAKICRSPGPRRGEETCPPFRLMMLSYRLKRVSTTFNRRRWALIHSIAAYWLWKIRWARQQNGLTGWNNPFHRDTSDRLDGLAGLLTRWSRHDSAGVR